jgi:hypothetical protein
MSAPDQNCQELCTAIASGVSAPVQALGVCDYQVSNPLEDVVVTGCTVEEAFATPISDTRVLVTVNVAVDFTAVEASSGLPFSAQCETSIPVIVTLAPPPAATISEQFPCTTDVTCTAQYAGFEPAPSPDISAEEFIISVTGSVSCTSCAPATVNVQLCPTAD